MRILWIEDFPANSGEESQPSSLAKELFNDLLGSFEEYDKDEKIEKELRRYFKKKSCHEISICHTFQDYLGQYDKNYLNYDIIIIDINLTEGSDKTKVPEEYKDTAENFSKKAGFYIWNLLVRKGFPENQIAFMTGNGNLLNDFKKHCVEAYIPPLKDENVFEKSKKHYQKFREWLKPKAKDPYINLRRGILDGCTLLLKWIKKIKSNESILLNLVLKDEEEKLDKNYAIEYLTNLKNFFLKDFILSQEEKEAKFRNFLFSLVAEWDKTYIQKGQPMSEFPKYNNQGWEDSEKTFQITNLWLLKNLRHSLVHFSFSKNLNEKDIAFYFILAMRNFFNLNSSKIRKYEKVLLSLEEEKINTIELKKKNEETKAVLEAKTDNSSKDFIDKAYALVNPENREKKLPKETLQNLSKPLFYNVYLHQLEEYLIEENSKKIFYLLANFAIDSIDEFLKVTK